MNKRLIAHIMTLFLLMLAGCGKKTEAVTEATTESVTETIVVIETAPGTAINAFGNPEDVFGTEATEKTNPTEKPVDPTEPKPTEQKPTEQKATEPKATEPKPTTPKPTEPKPTEPKPAEPTIPKEEHNQSAPDEPSEYEKYLNMSGDEQTAFIESFSSPMDFFNWLNDAKAEHEAKNPGIIVDGGAIDLEQVTGSK